MSSWNGLKRGFKLVCATLAGLAVQASVPAEAKVEARPALWKLADADTTIYLFGTIHMLPKDYQWRTAAIDQALRASDELVLETVIDANAVKSAGAVATLGVTEGLPPLVDRVPADKREILVKQLAALGLPANGLDRLESWAAAMTLLGAAFKDIGLDAGAGVERTLSAGDKKVSGLETVEQQFGFLDGLSEEAQRMFLVGVLDDPQAARDNFKEMLTAWTTGDVDGIARSFDSETALSPELRDVLMNRRNAKWAEWLAHRLEQPGTIMVAVGAGHLAGPNSVQALLAQRGLKVTRVQ